MDKVRCREVRQKIDEALAELSKKIGMKVSITGNATFDVGYVKFTVTACEVTEAGVTQTPEAENYRRQSHYEGLPASTLGWTFTSRGKDYVIVGMNLKARTMPILATCGETKYKFSAAAVIANLKAQKPADFAAAIADDPKLKSKAG